MVVVFCYLYLFRVLFIIYEGSIKREFGIGLRFRDRKIINFSFKVNSIVTNLFVFLLLILLDNRRLFVI